MCRGLKPQKLLPTNCLRWMVKGVPAFQDIQHRTRQERPQHQLLHSKVVVEDRSHVSLVCLSHLQEKEEKHRVLVVFYLTGTFLDCKIQYFSAHVVLQQKAWMAYGWKTLVTALQKVEELKQSFRLPLFNQYPEVRKRTMYISWLFLAVLFSILNTTIFSLWTTSDKAPLQSFRSKGIQWNCKEV